MMCGYIEKDWGTNFPKDYLWCQANNFERKNTSLFLSVADVPFKRINLKGFICIFLLEGKEYRFATYNLAKVKNIEINKDADVISILIRKNMYKLYINIRKAPSADATNALHLGEHRKLNLVTSEKSNNFSCVIKRENGQELIAPTPEGMKKTIKESLNSELSVKLLKGSQVLFEGFSPNTGLEIVGEGI